MCQRKLQELLTLYSLECEYKDIYVEGIGDKLFLEMLVTKNKPGVRVKEVNDVDLTELYREKPEIKSNCKRKLIALSEYLHRELGNSTDSVLCVVDKDFDVHLNLVKKNNFLLYTDYNSIELYFFNKKSLSFFLKYILHDFPIEIDIVVQYLQDALCSIYLAKLALLNVLGVNTDVNKYDLKKVIVINKADGKIEFKTKCFFLNYLSSLHKQRLMNSVESEYSKIIGKTHCDVRSKIRGHDLVYILYLYVKKMKGDLELSYALLERIILLCIDVGEFERTNLYSLLNKRFLT